MSDISTKLLRGYNPAERGGGPRRLRCRWPVREDEIRVRDDERVRVWRHCAPGQGARERNGKAVGGIAA